MSAYKNALWKLFLLLCVLILCTPVAKAQFSVAGKVIAEDTREPLPGANVFLEGTMHGTATDERGRFKLSNIERGTYTLIVSMVGYAGAEKKISAQAPNSALSNLRLALSPKSIPLKGVTVEGDRSEWLERLRRFRESFFGNVPNAEECEFVNPEVLAFEEEGNALVAHAKRPLRFRNEALGYEVTYHLPLYKARPNSWKVYGGVEFDTLMAENEEEREQWAQARRETYSGSLYHFIDALKASVGSGEDVLSQEGFRVSSVSPSEMRSADSKLEVTADAEEIFRMMTEVPGRAILSIPDPRSRDTGLLVQYNEGGYFPASVRSSSPQTSLIRFVDSKSVYIDTKTGHNVRLGNGHYVLEGHWGMHMTAATALPANYRPSDADD